MGFEILKIILIISVVSGIIGILAVKLENTGEKEKKELEEYKRSLDTKEPGMLKYEAGSNFEKSQELKRRTTYYMEAACIMVALWVCFTEGVPEMAEYFSFGHGMVSNIIQIIGTVAESLFAGAVVVAVFCIAATIIAAGIERFSEKFALIITVAIMIAMLYFF